MMRTKKWGRALLLGGALALAACSGSNGKDGANGANGADGAAGTNGANGVNGVTGKMSLTIDSVVTANGTSTLTFTIRPAALVCPGAVCSTNLSTLGQKTFYAQEYNTTNGTFDTARNFPYGTSSSTGGNTVHFVGFSTDGNGAQYTVTAANVTWSPETSTNAFVYGYVATAAAVPAPTTGHYMLPGMVASAAKVFGTVAYTSAANVEGCERCHGAPYSKHGYRQGRVAGLGNLVSCKVCHTDQRVGSDGGWYTKADDPANFDPNVWDTIKYAYTANLMNDTHNSHAFEFNYPQSMANCVTCHAGKLDVIFTDANFTPMVCKSCHPVHGPDLTAAGGGVEKGRAPSMLKIWQDFNVSGMHTTFTTGTPIDLYTNTDPAACNVCHKAGGIGKTFAKIHLGYGAQIYADPASANSGIKLSSARKTTIDSISYDAASYVATVSFSVSGVSTTATVASWSAYAGLYAWDTKDFFVRQSVTVTQQADKSKFVGTVSLASYAAQIASGQYKRAEIVLMPTIGIDPTVVTTDKGSIYTTQVGLNVTTVPNFAAVAAGATATIDLTQTAADPTIAASTSYAATGAKKIVDTNKCNACHDALGTTFHSPRNGSATTVACRICHNPTSSAGYYEMQSRSLDSFIHAAHSMAYGDPGTVDLTDPIQKLRYDDKVEGNYPNFAGPLNCESCHYAGTYDPPDQAKSTPALLSALTTPTGRTGLGSFPNKEIVGPGARACGGCHRAKAINEADGTKLAAFVAHTNDFSSAVFDATALTSTAAYIEYAIGGSTNNVAAPAGAQVEQCEICHSTSGTQHQKLFNVWKSGL